MLVIIVCDVLTGAYPSGVRVFAVAITADCPVYMEFFLYFGGANLQVCTMLELRGSSN